MKLQQLRKIFDGDVFRIPDYQRGYSWEKPHLEDLWSDLEILDKDRTHYAGVLSVVPNPGGNENDSFKEYHIVDGQQRLATLILLIHVICHRCKSTAGDPGETWIKPGTTKAAAIEQYMYRKTGETTGHPVFGYSEDDPSHDHFKAKILGHTDIDPNHEKTLYMRNLDYAEDFLTRRVENLSSEKVQELFTKVTEKLMFNYYELDANDELGQFVAFEVMNNRGKPLSALELLKNRLIYLSVLLKEKKKDQQKLRSEINTAWKNVYAFFGKNPDNVLDDDDFLRAWWIMNFKSTNENYQRDLLHDKLTAKKVKDGELGLHKIRGYVRDMNKVVEHYFYMHNPLALGCPYSDKVKGLLRKLNRLPSGFEIFKPLVCSILSKSDPQSDISQEKVAGVLDVAERFIFVAYQVYMHRSDKGKSLVYALAEEFHKNSSMLDAKKLSARLSNLGVSDEVARNDFRKEVEKKGGGNAFYAWSGLHYFLYEYESSLHAGGDPLVTWENVENKTIEHIYPQTPGDGWGAFSGQENVLHDLGNLLLLSHSLNVQASNNSFAVKREKYGKSSHSALELFEEYDNWTPDDVEKRSKKMLDFLWKHWKLKEGEDKGEES